MKAVHCTRHGSHKDLEVVEIPTPPAPGPGQAKVAIAARSIQFSDLVRFSGTYQVQTPLPFIVGGEAAGVVAEVDDDVDSVAVGDKVLCSGGCVEQINIKATSLTKIPQGIELNIAASYRNNYATALYGLQRAQIQPGEVLLVHGAAGGVGLAAVDLGKLFGATVIATASSDDKLKVVTQMGADHTINYSEGFREQVKELTNGKGADVIYDPVGGDVFEESMRCIAPFGRILVLGFTSGASALAKTNHLLVKEASVIGYTVGSLQKYRPEQSRKNNRVLMTWLENKRISPYISHTLPMDDIQQAYQLIVDRKVIGKVIVTN